MIGGLFATNRLRLPRAVLERITLEAATAAVEVPMQPTGTHCYVRVELLEAIRAQLDAAGFDWRKVHHQIRADVPAPIFATTEAKA